MKKMLAVTAIALFSTVAFAENCSKETTEAKINAYCEKISKKGDSVKAEWPNSLKFTNCGENYIWVQDTTPDIKMVMHPIKQAMNGSPLKDVKDKKGFVLFSEFDKMAKAHPNGGWVEYVWPKPGTEDATPKTSFVKLCKMPSGDSWVIGSGLWKADLK